MKNRNLDFIIIRQIPLPERPFDVTQIMPRAQETAQVDHHCAERIISAFFRRQRTEFFGKNVGAFWEIFGKYGKIQVGGKWNESAVFGEAPPPEFAGEAFQVQCEDVRGVFD